MNNFFNRLLNAGLFKQKNDNLTTANRQTGPLQVEHLEPRMMLNGTVIFEAGFEDANVAAGDFDFFTSVSGFTSTRGAVEIQNNHPAVGPAAQGQRHLELDGNNEIAVDIDVASAAGLSLDLQYSPRGGATLQENEIEVLFNGEVVATLAADGSQNRTTDFQSFSIDLPVDGNSTTGQLVFRSVFSGGRGVGGLLDDIVVTAQLAPLAIEAIADQTVGANTTLNLDVDLQPANSDTDVTFRLLSAPRGATIDSETGQFRFRASEANIAATEDRATETVVGTPQTVLFAGFEEVEVSARRFDFFDSVSGFEATGRVIEVQENHAAVGPASQGTQHIELDGQNGITRTIDTVQGDLYELTFDFSPRAGADAATNAIEVLWDGRVIHEVTADGRGNQSTDFSSVTVDLSDFSGDRTQLEFRSQSPGTSPGLGGLIDNVRVTRRTVTTETSANPFQVVVRATDSNGRTDTETFNIIIDQDTPTVPATVTAPPVEVPPVVEQPPAIVAAPPVVEQPPVVVDEPSSSTQLGPLAIEAIADQTIAANRNLFFDADLLPPNNDTSDVNFELVQAPFNATIDSQTGLFRFRASDANVANTLARATETVVGTPQTVLFAGFEDVEVSARRFDFFDSISGFEATGRAIEVQENHPAVGPASQGTQHIELDGQNGIVTTIDTVEGDLYELTFDFSPRAGADAATNAIEVLWDGEVIREVTADGRGNQSTNFTTITVDLSDFSGDRTQLEFRSQSAGTSPGLGGLIDNVRVTRRAVTTVTSENPFEVIVRATDSDGRTDTETFNIIIDNEIQAVPAAITAPPVNVAPVVEQPPAIVAPQQPVIEEPPVDVDESSSTVVANFRDDFQVGTLPANWQFFWNAPNDFDGTSSIDGSTGEIGEPDNYVPLEAFGNSYAVNGDPNLIGGSASFLRLNAFGGHPGIGQLQRPTNSGNNTRARYAIAAYTVQADGFYAIEDSFLSTTNPDGQVDVLVHVNRNDPAIRTTVAGGTTENFDTGLGFLNQGDVIYVAFGPGDTQVFDSFQHDFSIVQTTGPEFSLQASDGRTGISESGSTDTFEVVLHQRPTSNVVIELTNSDPREFNLSTERLVFTPSNFDVAQTVTATAVDDSRADGLQRATITAEILSTASAAEYRQVDDQSIAVTIVDNDAVTSLQTQVDQGLQAGLEEIVLTPGVYESESPNSFTPHLSIVGAEDVSIVADGVTLLATSLTSAVRVHSANNLSIEGLTIDYDPLPFTQGTVVGVAADLSYFDVRIHDGYDLLPNGTTTRAIIHDATDRLVKSDTFTRFGSSVTTLGGRVVRISNNHSADALATGDLVSLTRDVLSPHALTIDRSSEVRVEDVTVHASTSFAFFETGSSGNEYVNLTVTPGATPEGATEARLLSSNFDTFHSKYAAEGPSIVGANFDSGGDDGVAINSDFALVAGSRGDSVIITTQNNDPYIRAGDLLRFASADGDTVYERTVLSIERYETGDIDFNGIANANFTGLSQLRDNFQDGFELTLSDPVPSGVGDRITNLSRTGSGFEIIDSNISNSRARGLVLKASDGLVSGNTITDFGTAGILVSPEATFFAEAGFTDSLVIDNNIISQVGFTASNPLQNRAGGIIISADVDDTTRGHRDIQITNNQLHQVSGINLTITNAEDVDVIGNQFTEAQPFVRTHGSGIGLDSGTLVFLDNVSDVTFRANAITDLGPGNDRLILASSTASNVFGGGARTGLVTS